VHNCEPNELWCIIPGDLLTDAQKSTQGKRGICSIYEMSDGMSRRSGHFGRCCRRCGGRVVGSSRLRYECIASAT
jgi:hypothetical protein